MIKNQSWFLVIFVLIVQVGFSQTNVSGGIFSNSVWTQKNSPYIVTGNIVVFPSIVLTIEPGVTIKFNDGVNLEVREGSLLANGTSTEPIVFTSNNPKPVKGSWDQIWVNQSLSAQFNHCEFHYAAKGLTGQCDSLSVVNSVFLNNVLGMEAKNLKYIRVDSCIFRSNETGQISSPGTHMSINHCKYVNNAIGLNSQAGSVINCIIDSNSVTGLIKHMACNDTIRNNQIYNNGIGIAHDYSGCGGVVFILDNTIIFNNIGILLGGSQTFEIHNNKICSNSEYDLKNLSSFSANAANNCWCLDSDAAVQAKIFDAHDDVNYGIVTYLPLNNKICPFIIGIETYTNTASNLYTLYPNPFKSTTTLKFENAKSENYSLLLYDMYGRLVRKISGIVTNELEIKREGLTAGIFFFQLQSEKGIVINGNFIID